MSQYFYTRPGRIFGPVSSEDLRRLVASGVIRADDLVARDGTSKFRVAIEIEGLEFAPTAPMSTPPPPPVVEQYAPSIQATAELDVEEPTSIEFYPPIVSRPGSSMPRSTRFGVGFVIAIILGAPTGWLVTRLPPIQEWMARERAQRQRTHARRELERLSREAEAMRQAGNRDVRVIVSEETRKILGDEADSFSGAGVDR